MRITNKHKFNKIIRIINTEYATKIARENILNINIFLTCIGRREDKYSVLKIF